jgi:hypothetical protein
MLHEVIEGRIYRAYEGQYNLIEAEKQEKTFELTKEQNTIVEECFDYFESVIRELQLTTQIISIQLEARTSAEYLGIPEVAGTADVIIISEDRIDIIDWKFGKGVPVYAPKNVQGMSYAIGVLNEIEYITLGPDIHIHIAQPRCDYFGSWTITSQELYNWAQTVLIPAIEASREANAKCVPGEEQCRWCVGTLCDERNQYMKDAASQIFMAYAKPKPVSSWAEDKEIVDLLNKSKIVSAFIKELTAAIMDRCISDEGFPGYKLVAGRSNRYWRDEQAAQDYMDELMDAAEYDIELEDVYETKFISVAKAEKLHKSFKKDSNFKELYYKAPGEPVLAPESDPRESITVNATSAFKKYVK